MTTKNSFTSSCFVWDPSIEIALIHNSFTFQITAALGSILSTVKPRNEAIRTSRLTADGDAGSLRVARDEAEAAAERVVGNVRGVGSGFCCPGNDQAVVAGRLGSLGPVAAAHGTLEPRTMPSFKAADQLFYYLKEDWAAVVGQRKNTRIVIVSFDS